MAATAQPRSLAELFRHLGNTALCGRCASSIKRIMEDSAAPAIEKILANSFAPRPLHWGIASVTRLTGITRTT
jgi:bacterioferritin-associated ferredoxin